MKMCDTGNILSVENHKAIQRVPEKKTEKERKDAELRALKCEVCEMEIQKAISKNTRVLTKATEMW